MALTLTEEIVVVVSAAIILSAGTTIYHNRKKTNKLYQRLFGLNEDEIDGGYVIEIDRKMDVIDEKIDELNHQRITDLEGKLERVDDSIVRMQKRMDAVSEPFGGDGEDYKDERETEED